MDSNKINTVIITPAYLHQQNDIYKEIQKNFAEDLVIVGIYEDTTDLDLFTSPDFIITTLDMEALENEFKNAYARVVTVHEFITKHDLTLVGKAIEAFKHRRYVALLQEKLPVLIAENFFLTYTQSFTKEEAMEKIAQTFMAAGYVDQHYLAKLLEREEISSTSFPSGVAIPHTMKYDAKKTGIVVLQPNEPVLWGDIDAKLVLGIAVNKADATIFNMIFPRMIELMAETYNLHYLARSKSQEEFINRLIELMGKDHYFPL